VGVTSLQAADGTHALRESPSIETPDAESSARMTASAEALDARDYVRVLALTESPSSAPTGAWLDYDRAAALTGLGRTDEAAEVFKKAELRFAEAGDEARRSPAIGARARDLYVAGDQMGRSVAIWGRARALSEAGRCAEARSAYQEYEAFVRQGDPRAAEMAVACSRACRPVAVLR
jgi:hypothetical protein